MRQQHVPIDPRYRDSRPFVRSSSSIYDNARRDFMSRRRSSSSLQEDVLRPFQLLQMNEFLRRSSPTMSRQLSRESRSTSPNVSDKSNSNWNLNPSILIEEYDDSKLEEKSTTSSTNLNQVEYHQPLCEESVAPFAGRDEIPFIDDDNILISAHDPYCDNPLPDVNSKHCSDSDSKPAIPLDQPHCSNYYHREINCNYQPPPPPPPPLPHSSQQKQRQPIKSRKTVSFDLMDNVEPNTSAKFSALLNNVRSNSCDDSSNVMLNRLSYGAGTRTETALDKTNNAVEHNLTEESNEPIFKFCSIKRNESFNKNIPNLDSDNYSAYFFDDDTINDQKLPKATIETTVKTRASDAIDPNIMTLDLSGLHSNSTTSSLTPYASIDPTSTCDVHSKICDRNEIDAYAKQINEIVQLAAHKPIKCDVPEHLSNGKVMALKNYFERMPHMSISTPNLSTETSTKLTDSEQKDVLKQLDQWSKFGTLDSDSLHQRDRLSQSVFNLRVTTSIDDPLTSNIHVSESKRSVSDSNVNTLNLTNSKRWPYKSISPPNSAITLHYKQYKNNQANSCINLYEIESAMRMESPSSRLKASIYHSPCHRSAYLTLREIKRNRKINKLARCPRLHSARSGATIHVVDDTDAADETR